MLPTSPVGRKLTMAVTGQVPVAFQDPMYLAAVVDLLGAIAIDPVGQAALGVAVGAHLDATLRRIAAALERGPLNATWLAPPTRVARTSRPTTSSCAGTRG